MLDQLREQMLVQEEERLASLALRNRILTVGLVVWGVLLLGWLIYSFVRGLLRLRAAALAGNDVVSFVCSCCGKEFALPVAYLAKHPFQATKSTVMGVPGVEGTVSLSRRLRCLACGRHSWCRQEMGKTVRLGAAFWRQWIRETLPRFLIVELGILAAGGIFVTVVRTVFG